LITNYKENGHESGSCSDVQVSTCVAQLICNYYDVGKLSIIQVSYKIASFLVWTMLCEILETIECINTHADYKLNKSATHNRIIEKKK